MMNELKVGQIYEVEGAGFFKVLHDVAEKDEHGKSQVRIKRWNEKWCEWATNELLQKQHKRAWFREVSRLEAAITFVRKTTNE